MFAERVSILDGAEDVYSGTVSMVFTIANWPTEDINFKSTAIRTDLLQGLRLYCKYCRILTETTMKITVPTSVLS